MSIFLLELVLSSIAIQGYLFSFFFWLDILSTLSMLMDINMFTDVVFSMYDVENVAALRRAPTSPRSPVSPRHQERRLELFV